MERALIQADGHAVSFDNVMPGSFAPTPLASAKHGAPSEKAPFPAEQGRQNQGDVAAHLRLDEVKAQHIGYTIELTGGRIEGKNGAAVLLGMNPATLRCRMQKLGIPFGRTKSKEEKANQPK